MGVLVRVGVGVRVAVPGRSVAVFVGEGVLVRRVAVGLGVRV
jgi:hypothetical protein